MVDACAQGVVVVVADADVVVVVVVILFVAVLLVPLVVVCARRWMGTTIRPSILSYPILPALSYPDVA